MSVGYLRRITESLWTLHRWTYRLSDGRLGGRVLGMPVLLLTTTGRRSGRLRTTALTYFPVDSNFAVIASNGGAPQHPFWLLNLRAQPRAQIQVGPRRMQVWAREAGGAERERFWSQAVRAYSAYATYQRRTSRRIPVVVLRPESELLE